MHHQPPGRPIVKLVPVDDAEGASSVWQSVEEAQAKYGSLGEGFDLSERSSEMRPSPLDDA